MRLASLLAVAMVSLRLFLLVIFTLVCRECANVEPRIDFLQSAVAAIGLSLGFGLLFKFSALVVLRDWQAHRAGPDVLQRFGTYRRAIETTWVAMLPVTLLLSGWAPWAKALAEAGWPQSIALVLLFVPSLAFIILIELTAAQFEEIFCDVSRPSGSSAPSWPQLWRLRIRLGEFANLLLCLLPVLLISICNDAFQLAPTGLSENTAAVLSTCVALLLILVIYPSWIGVWMGVSEIPKELGDRIEGYRRAVGVGPLAARLMVSGNRWNGAAVVGWFPYFRKLWLGDALIHQLNAQQLDMVILHELAHVRRFHFLWRCLPIVGASGMACLAWVLLDTMAGESAPSWAAKLVGLTVGAGVMLAGLGAVSRWCELDADSVACQLAETACPWARDNPGAAATALAGSLTNLLSSSKEAAGRTWLHPSLRERLVNLAVDIDLRLSNR